MAEVKIKLGVDGNELTKGLNQARQQVETFGKSAQTAIAKTNVGVMGRGFAGMGVQIQDVAVQMQMGTNFATIFAQQGSQIASGFGAAGIAIGAAVAVIGGLYTAGSKSVQMFGELIKGVRGLSSETDKIIATGSLSEIASQTEKIAAAQKDINEQSGALSTMSGAFAPVLGMPMGGASPQERQNQLAREASDLEFKRQKLALAALAAAQEEIKIAELRAKGSTKEADELERKAKLNKEIAKIWELPFSTQTQADLVDSAIKLSELQKKQQVNTYDIAKNIQEQADAANKILAPYQQFLNYLDQAKQKQDQLNAAAKAAKQIAQTKVESQKNFAQSLEDEVKILEAKATGDEDAIKKAEREVEIKNRAREIQQQLGKNAKEALDIAERMQALQEAANEAAEGKGKREGRIQGYSQERQGGRDEARERAVERAGASESRRREAMSRGFEGLDPAYARGDFGYFDSSREAVLKSSFEAGRYYKPEKPIDPNNTAPPIKAPTVSNSENSNNNASVTVLTELKTLTERMTKAVESIAVV
jgi:hypothetical protein